MKIDFKPTDSRKITLFSNMGEAIVFWLCIGGLFLLTTIIIVRSIDRGKTRDVFREFRVEQDQILQKIESLENENKTLKKQNDSLRVNYLQLKSRLKPVRKTSPDTKVPSVPSPSRKLNEQEKNRLKFLNASKRK